MLCLLWYLVSINIWLCLKAFSASSFGRDTGETERIELTDQTKLNIDGADAREHNQMTREKKRKNMSAMTWMLRLLPFGTFIQQTFQIKSHWNLPQFSLFSRNVCFSGTPKQSINFNSIPPKKRYVSGNWLLTRHHFYVRRYPSNNNVIKIYFKAQFLECI